MAPSASPSPADVLRVPRRSIPRSMPSPLPDKAEQAKRAWGAPLPGSGLVVPQPAGARDWVPQGIRVGGREFWYLIIMQSFGAALISGGINFGVAVACYRQQDGTRFWPFVPLTVAGDMGVTVVIQQIISMLITSALCHGDINGGPVAPLQAPWPPLLHLPSSPSPHGHLFGPLRASSPDGKPLALPMGRAAHSSAKGRWFFWALRAACTGSERDNWTAKGIGARARVQRILWTAVHGGALCVLSFWWYWPIAIAITAPLYGGRDLGRSWIPCVIKAIFGGVLALLTNPIMALMAMGAEYNVRRAYPDHEPFISAPDGAAYYAAWRRELGLDADAAMPEAAPPLKDSAHSSPATTTQERQAALPEAEERFVTPRTELEQPALDAAAARS